MAVTTVTIKSVTKTPGGPRRVSGECTLINPDLTWSIRTGMLVVHATVTYKGAAGAAIPYYAIGTGADADKVTFTASTSKTLTFEVLGIE